MLPEGACTVNPARLPLCAKGATAPAGAPTLLPPMPLLTLPPMLTLRANPAPPFAPPATGASSAGVAGAVFAGAVDVAFADFTTGTVDSGAADCGAANVCAANVGIVGAANVGVVGGGVLVVWDDVVVAPATGTGGGTRRCARRRGAVELSGAATLPAADPTGRNAAAMSVNAPGGTPLILPLPPPPPLRAAKGDSETPAPLAGKRNDVLAGVLPRLRVVNPPPLPPPALLPAPNPPLAVALVMEVDSAMPAPAGERENGDGTVGGGEKGDVDALLPETTGPPAGVVVEVEGVAVDGVAVAGVPVALARPP